MRKILYVSGTRADYGLMKPVLKNIYNRNDLQLEIIATGMHLMNEFGNTIEEIKKEGFTVHKINAIYEYDNKESMTNFISNFIRELTIKIKEINPDIILVLGDRAEMLSTAIVGAYLIIPVAHLQGGEVTSTVDEFSRHAITKLSHIHFPATTESANRILRLGEEKNRIFVVGAPAIDYISNTKFMNKKELCNRLNLDPHENIILVLQHPVTSRISKSGEDIEQTLKAITELGSQSVIIYPNSDPGSRRMIEQIKKYESLENIHIFKNLEYDLFLSLMKNSDVMVGNSSSGIIEAPSFKLPIINIGERQTGRQRSSNIIDCDYNKEEIINSIKRGLSSEFKKQLEGLKNPYGNGNTGEKVTDILASINIDDKLKQKKISY